MRTGARGDRVAKRTGPFLCSCVFVQFYILPPFHNPYEFHGKEGALWFACVFAKMP